MAKIGSLFVLIIALMIHCFVGLVEAEVKLPDLNSPGGQLTTEEEAQLLKKFHSNLDKDADGKISRSELFGVIFLFVLFY